MCLQLPKKKKKQIILEQMNVFLNREKKEQLMQEQKEGAN